MLNACRNYLNRGFKLVVIVSGHNPQIQQNAMDEVCYLMRTPEGKEPAFFTMEYTPIEEGNPRRRSDHAGGYETSMMLYLNGDRVNIKANDGQKERRLALGEEYPFEEATADEGKIRFDLQVEGLIRLTKEKLRNLL
jgi:creatinine amidohydrolase